MTDIDIPSTLLACLYMHRLATSSHLHALLGIDRLESTTRRQMQQFAREGLVTSVTLPRPGRTLLWSLTATGRDLCASWPELRDRDYPVTPTEGSAVRLRAPHTLAVLRTHLAFLADARRRGDEYGPLDWAPEVYHRISEQRADALIADALMRYTAAGANGVRRQLRAFVELDRSTMSSERLASKLMTYGRFLEYAPSPAGAERRGGGRVRATEPVWQRSYPIFPRVLFVLTDAPRPVLERRIGDLRAMAAGNPLAARMARRVPLGAAVLEDLQSQGPSAAVWTPLDGEDTAARGWMDL
jgi:DNA-binding MarR family transcriptional regulator